MFFRRWMLWLWRDESSQAQNARRWLKILFIAALFAGLFWIIPLRQVAGAVLDADPLYLAVGVALGTLSTLLTAFELEPLTRHARLPHSVWQILSINLAVKFYSQFTPTTLVGSGLRWYRLAQPGNKAAESLAALAFFRVLETFLTIAMGVGFFVASGNQTVQLSWVTLAALVAAIIVGWIGITRWSVPLYQVFKRRSGGLLERRWLKPVARRLEKFINAVAAFADISAWRLFLAVFWGAASVISGVASGTVMAQAMGIDIGFMQMGWIQAIILLATQLPFAVAGGLGIREVTLVALLAGFGVSAEKALALSFLLLVRGLLISLLGGVTEGIEALRGRKQPLPAASELTKKPKTAPENAGDV
jgi:uncharacterized protein (TIRG00374 family)